MKVVILAGGMGTRISEESHLKPKPMIEIGERPILWHIMKIYSSYGFNEFVICLGYKGYVIKEYFANYFLHQSDVTFNFCDNHNQLEVHSHTAEPWRVTLVDTGLPTMTGGRLKRVQPYIGNEPFMLTYGDGVADVDIKGLLEFHKSNNKVATLTSIQPWGRFGALNLDDRGTVVAFKEKPKGDASWINGGFFVFKPEIFEYLADDNTILERDPLEALCAKRQLMAYKHGGFWQCMDTLRDKILLEESWSSGKAPWKKW